MKDKKRPYKRWEAKAPEDVKFDTRETSRETSRPGLKPVVKETPLPVDPV
jgi:hypothetical protein